jgi:hypothetical protein
MSSNTKLTARTLVLACLLLAAGASAQDDWKAWPTGQQWRIGAALFVPSLDTQLVVTDPEGVVGSGISFENNLGLDDSKSTLLVGVDWRFFKRHKVSYRYFDLSRNADAESSVAISIGGEELDITLPIQSFFDISANELAYSFSLLFDERKDLYLGIGLSVQDLDLGVRGTASSPNPGEIVNSQLATTAPLPTLNIGFNYAFNEKWMFVSQLGWLAVEADFATDEKLEGQIINANVGVEWLAFKHVGFFAKYQLFDVDVDITDSDTIFAVDYDYQGPLLGLNVTF